MSKVPEDYINLIMHMTVMLDMLKDRFIYKTAYNDTDVYLIKSFKNNKELDTLYILRKDCKLPILTFQKIGNYKFRVENYDENGTDVLFSRIVSTSKDLNELSEEIREWLNNYKGE